MTTSKERSGWLKPAARGSTVSEISSVWVGSSRSRQEATTCSSSTPTSVGSSSKAVRAAREAARPAEAAALAGEGEPPGAPVAVGPGQPAPGGPLEAADLEDVGEVGAEGEAHGEVDRGGAVVLDPDALVQAAVDHPGAADVDRALDGRDRAVLLDQVLVGQVDMAGGGPVGAGRPEERRVPRRPP